MEAIVNSRDISARKWAMIMWGFNSSFIAALAIGPMIGALIAHVAVFKFKTTLYHSHFLSSIIKFWSCILFWLAPLVMWTSHVAFGLFVVTFLWYIVHSVRGFLKANAEKPIENPYALW